MRIVKVKKILATVVGIVSVVAAQNTAPAKPPAQLTDAASIVKWLDDSMLPLARVGIEIEVDESLVDEMFKYEMMLSESALFSGGFRLKSLDGCRLTLRNDNVELLQHFMGSYNPKNTRLKSLREANSTNSFYSEVVVPLKLLREMKRPSSTGSKRAEVLGKWRSSFKTRRYEGSNGILVGVRSHSDDQFYTSMWGETLIFRFDDKDSSEGFHSAFKKLIDLCPR